MRRPPNESLIATLRGDLAPSGIAFGSREVGGPSIDEDRSGDRRRDTRQRKVLRVKTTGNHISARSTLLAHRGDVKRVLIVNTFFDPFRRTKGSPYRVPRAMGPVYLASAFSPARCEVRLYSEQYSGPLEDVDLLGWADMLVLTGLTASFDRMLHLTAYARALKEGMIVVAGGAVGARAAATGAALFRLRLPRRHRAVAGDYPRDPGGGLCCRAAISTLRSDPARPHPRLQGRIKPILQFSLQLLLAHRRT